MSDHEQHNCGQHERRSIPHWDGDRWCNGRASKEAVR